ncbi:MAG: VanZ family protein [Xanthobacteraceae bacterium]|nr:VanZ family protein [Xanthobacteraceae bacterium]
MIKRILSVAPWASLAFVAAATLSPLTLRPHMSAAHVEHLAAYAFIGLLFGLVYPRQTFLNGVVVLGTATLLEVLQLMTPDRHGRIADLGFKLAGAIAGIVAAKIAARQIALWRR